jgi:hypothetical protein
MSLDPARAALVKKVDGHRTIHEILTLAGRSVPLGPRGPDATGDFDYTLFQWLWQQDFLSIGLAAG